MKQISLAIFFRKNLFHPQRTAKQHCKLLTRGLQFSGYGVRPEILSFRPADSGKKQTHLLEIAVIIQMFEKIASDVWGYVKYS
jgi:hypothetical protein